MIIRSKPRIGIYAGSFDPIHVGHITFALQALKASKLDSIYFLPERNPRSKVVQEHFGHRVAMIKQAIKPYKRFKLLELDDKRFSVSKTLPKLTSVFGERQMVFLFGSDKVNQLASWPNADKLFVSSGLIIGLRQGDDLSQIKLQAKARQPKSLDVINSYAPDVASTKIRASLTNNQAADGLLTSVSRYIRRNWLYISIN